jgi:anti-anti-sigma regulatory factor
MRRSRHGRHHVVTALVEEDGDARITLTGHLGGDAVDGLADELAAVLRNADRVTVDLDGLSTPDPAALGVFATALDRAGGWVLPSGCGVCPQLSARRFRPGLARPGPTRATREVTP